MKFRPPGRLAFLILLVASLFTQSRTLCGQATAPENAPPVDDAAKRLLWLKSRLGPEAAVPSSTPAILKKHFADKRAPALRPLEESPVKPSTPKSPPEDQRSAVAPPAAATPAEAPPHVKKPSAPESPASGTSLPSIPGQTAKVPPATTPRPGKTDDPHAVAAHADKATLPKITPAEKKTASTAATPPPATDAAPKKGQKPAGGTPSPAIAQTAKTETTSAISTKKTASTGKKATADATAIAAQSKDTPAADQPLPNLAHPQTAEANPKKERAADAGKTGTPKNPAEAKHVAETRAGTTPAVAAVTADTHADQAHPKKGPASANPVAEVPATPTAETARTAKAVAAGNANTPAKTTKTPPSVSPATETHPVVVTEPHVNKGPTAEALAAHPPAAKTPPASPHPAVVASRYPWKAGIVTTVFWIGEPVGGHNFTPNYASSWDGHWTRAYGGYDNPDPDHRRNFIPVKFVPRQNPFYVALPYNDVTRGTTKPEARLVIPWFKEAFQKEGQSVCKDRWVAIRNRAGKMSYAQWSDCGPFRTDHWQYVFGTQKPKPNLNQGAGLDVSPAVRDYLGLQSTDVTDWRFVDAREVPSGPWALYGDNNTCSQRLRVAAKTSTKPKERKSTEVALTRIPAL